MGRHAVPEPPPEPLDAPEPSGPDLLGRAVLALTAGVTTLLATSWAGLPWREAGIAALGVAALVVLAAWVAGTMPPRPPSHPPSHPPSRPTPGPTPYSDARDSDRRDQ